jgi:SsrA-binding protein
MSRYAENRTARFDYEILDTFEAGLELRGHEVKSVRAGKVSLAGAYVLIRGREAFLVGARIDPYQAANATTEYEPDRTRRLLLKRGQIDEVEEKLDTAGVSAIPLSIYGNKGLIKLEVAIARGKRARDKRQSIKERETNREIRRIVKYDER